MACCDCTIDQGTSFIDCYASGTSRGVRSQFRNTAGHPLLLSSCTVSSSLPDRDNTGEAAFKQVRVLLVSTVAALDNGSTNVEYVCFHSVGL